MLPMGTSDLVCSKTSFYPFFIIGLSFLHLAFVVFTFSASSPSVRTSKSQQTPKHQHLQQHQHHQHQQHRRNIITMSSSISSLSSLDYRPVTSTTHLDAYDNKTVRYADCNHSCWRLTWRLIEEWWRSGSLLDTCLLVLSFALGSLSFHSFFGLIFLSLFFMVYFLNGNTKQKMRFVGEESFGV